MFGLFSFEYNAKGVPISNLVTVSGLKSSLKKHVKENLNGQLVNSIPKEVAVFTRGGIYQGYFIKKVKEIST